MCPSVVSSSSFGCQSVLSSWITGGLRGESSKISVTGWPARTAAEYTNGLKVEPGWRTACVARDRKSTRLNSSHGYISYAVFCLKKKKTTNMAAVELIHGHDSAYGTLKDRSGSPAKPHPLPALSTPGDVSAHTSSHSSYCVTGRS